MFRPLASSLEARSSYCCSLSPMSAFNDAMSSIKAIFVVARAAIELEVSSASFLRYSNLRVASSLASSSF